MAAATFPHIHGFHLSIHGLLIICYNHTHAQLFTNIVFTYFTCSYSISDDGVCVFVSVHQVKFDQVSDSIQKFASPSVTVHTKSIQATNSCLVKIFLF